MKNKYYTFNSRRGEKKQKKAKKKKKKKFLLKDSFNLHTDDSCFIFQDFL